MNLEKMNKDSYDAGSSARLQLKIKVNRCWFILKAGIRGIDVFPNTNLTHNCLPVCMFVIQYHFINLDDSFVYFWIVKNILFFIFFWKLRVFGIIGWESSWPRLLYRICTVLYITVYTTLPMWQFHAQLGFIKVTVQWQRQRQELNLITTVEL